MPKKLKIPFHHDHATPQSRKAQLASLINELIQAQGLTHEAAATVMKTTRARVSKVCQGKLHMISLDALMDFLVKLAKGVSIEIELKPVPKTLPKKWARSEKTITGS